MTDETAAPRVRTKSFLFATASAGSAVLLLAVLVLFKRTLGTDAYGRFSWALSLATIGEALMDFGLQQVTTRTIARDRASAPRVFQNLLSLKALPAVAIFGLLGAFAVVVKPDAEMRAASLLLLGSAILRSYLLTLRGVLLGLEDFARESLLVTGDRALLLAAVAIALAAGGGLVTVSMAFVIARLLAVGFGLVLTARHVGPIRPAFEIDYWHVLQREALPLGGFLIVLNVYNYIDTVLLGLMATDTETGLYNAAYRLYEGLTYAPAVIAAVLTPRLSHLWRADRGRHAQLVRRGLAVSVGLAVLGGIVTWIAAPWILSLVFGADAVLATAALRILAAGLVFVFAIWVLHAVAISTDAQVLLFRITIAGVVANTLLNVWLIPHYGRNGAALATVAGEALTLVLLAAGLGSVLMGRGPAPADEQPSDGTEFGNLEANLRFLDDSGMPTPAMRTLEIGSGRGTMVATLRKRGLEIVGVETSADRIRESRALHGELPIELTTGTALPFPDAAFDAVLSFDVFEHIPDSDAHLDEVRRVLRPGGWYLLQTPNKWTNTIFETIRWRSITRWRADHCSLHSYGQLDRRLRQHGFMVEFADVPTVTAFFREKVRRYAGPIGVGLLAVLNPDRWPRRLRTNLYARARKK